MIVNAYAKINLAINVLNKRDDGYHTVDMITIPLEMHDSIEIFEIPESAVTHITSDDPTLICDENNLAFKALAEFKKHYSSKRSYRIHIYKRIPALAGLGGGSADAAAVIKACCKLLKIDPTCEDVINIAANVGSDVPFCLFNQPSEIQGRGEVVVPLQLSKHYYVLIVKPKEGLSTKAVFDQFDQKQYENERPLSNLKEALENPEKELTNDMLFNALEAPAIDILPKVDECLKDLDSYGAKLYGMSGTGSACYCLSDNKEELETIKNEMELKGYDVYLTSFLGSKKHLKQIEKDRKKQNKLKRK